MSVRNLISSITVAMGVAITLGGCGEGQEQVDTTAVDTHQAAAEAYNGVSWNGVSWNGVSWNGIGWNGVSWNGMGWNGVSWNGVGWNGVSWNGVSWNGVSWNGVSWNGLNWNNVPGQNSPTFTTLHNWINHTDANGNGIPSADKINQCGPSGTYDPSYLNDNDDMMARVTALSYWVSCACASNVTIPFADTHGRYSTTFYGGLGLAPTWCGSDPNAVVPESETQIVSACLLARVNMKGKHFPLSMRTTEAGTALTTNEAFVSGRPLAQYWGNLWKQPHADNDSTTCPYDPNAPANTDCGNPVRAGGSWWNMERFSASVYTAGSVQYGTDQLPFGRDCEVSDCGGHLEYLGFNGGKMLGNQQAWNPSSPQLYYKSVDPGRSAQNVAGAVTFTQVANSQGGTNVATVNYRGNSWRVMQAYGPYMISLEDPLATYPAGPPYTTSWSQVEWGPIPANQSAGCANGATECQGAAQTGRKLFGLNNSQAISANLSGNLPPPYNFKGDPNEAMTVAIRYSRPTPLGSGQCDVDNGCAGTNWFECSSWSVSTLGCVGGVANPGQLRIWINNNTPATNGWAFVHGSGSAYGKNIFPPTYNDTQYNTAYIYPIYMQDSAAGISGDSDLTPNLTEYDTLRMWLSGDTANTSDAPNLDTAYYFPGPPPGYATCTGSAACWLYAGPNQGISQAQGTQFHYTSPFLPPGTYTFQINNVAGDLDLYVKANATATLTNFDCRPYLGTNTPESCTVTMPGNGGYFSVMVNGYAAGTSTATLVGKN